MAGSHDGRWYRILVVLLCVPAAWVLWFALQTVEPPDRSVWAAGGVVLVLHALARRYPLRLAAHGATTDLATSTAFGFALLLLVPAPLAVLGLALSALVPTRERYGTAWVRVALDVARTALSYGAAAATIHTIDGVLADGGVASLTPSWELLLVVMPAGFVAYAVDAVVTTAATATAQGAAVRSVFRQDHTGFDLPAHLLLVALAPTVVVISQRSLLLAPVVLIAVVGLYRSSRVVAAQQHDASHDALTGLVNRRELEQRLAALVESSSLKDPFALLLMDLDRFKEVNDQLGHHVGDQLLGEVGARVRALDGLDVAARIGGDEFAFVVRGHLEHAELVEQAERLVNEVARPYVVADVRLAIGASIGIAHYPDHGLDGPALLRRADSAMYAAKRSGVPVGVATVQRSADGPGRVSLVGELEEAMGRGELKLDYQPKIDLRTGEIAGMEALLRWHHPEHGLVSPGAFMSTVEHTDLIAPLTRHVVRLALEDAGRWEVAGVPLPIAINVSTRDLQDTRFPRDLGEYLDIHGFPASRLTLEITENALQIDPDRARQVLGELRDRGVALSIDDFGTGYSSLAALRTLPVTELKIDRSFVLGMTDAPGTAIVRSIVQLAHALGLSVVAEGVEREDDLWELRRHGCDVVQGFLFSKPLPAHLVGPWARARREEVGSDVTRRGAAPVI